MSEKPAISISDILADFNSRMKVAEDEEKPETVDGGDEPKEDVAEDAKDDSEDKEKGEEQPADDTGDKEDDDTLSDSLKDIAEEAVNEHTAALKKEAALFGQVFADSVISSMRRAATQEKLAELYDATYMETLKKLADAMPMPGTMPAMAADPAAQAGQQQPAMMPGAAPQPVDPNYGLMYPTPAAGPNLPGYFPPQDGANPEQVYPESLPPEEPAPAPALQPDPAAMKQVAKAVSSASDAAAEAARAAGLLSQALTEGSAAPEEAYPQSLPPDATPPADPAMAQPDPAMAQPDPAMAQPDQAMAQPDPAMMQQQGGYPQALPY